ncbi:serine/threonine-protein kinase Nek10-like [Amphiura filiformis]|uniref:serine/threonine-protein kinase Nek10-like n=1 Tax=Amphiura filiformis TaxID=82378 RepID=UPI003B222626
MPSGEKKSKQTDAASRETKDLGRLLDLLNTPASKQQLPSIDFDPTNNNNNNNGYTSANRSGRHSPPGTVGPFQHQSSEALALENFSTKYQNERNFSAHQYHKHFEQIFISLVKSRLCTSEWVERAPTENIVRVLICLRLLLRDQAFQRTLFELGGVKVLSDRLQTVTEDYLSNGDQEPFMVDILKEMSNVMVTEDYLSNGDQEPFMVDILKEMSNIFQKLSSDVKQREWLVACRAHRPLVLLLSASDVMVLHCSLYALIGLAQSPEPRAIIGELDCIETLLRIVQDYDILSKKLAASLLRTLCQEEQVREQVKICDGVPMLLSILHYDNLKLIWNVVWCLVQLAEDADTSNDIRLMGGIPLLLALLHDRQFTSDMTSTSSGLGSASTSGRYHSISYPVEDTEEVQPDQILALKSACCAALTELVHNDTNAQQIVLNNGIYYLGMQIFPQRCSNRTEAQAVNNLQKNAFRTLRFLFSMERNRQLFKRLFPPDLFEAFIDVGHYVTDISAYKPLVDKLNAIPKEKLEEIKQNFHDTNQNREPTKSIAGYYVYEHLGTGAFGSVYKVKKSTSGLFLAMKEINYNNPAIGKTSKEKEKSIDSIVSELTIIKEHLRHPNVVRYYRTFTEYEKLFIVMELIEGAPLYEHFNSLKEKGEKFSEERIWNIFIQLVLALRYLHKEKKIVHRDLTPNNIMLGENDKVTITDFGLARQKQPDCSKMTSVVGTILYNCPEIIQNLPYGEKSDVWAVGCILYQMCTLQPPFYSSNMLALASKIVEAQYDPVPEGSYSELVTNTIKSCLTAEADQRPDIVEVAGLIADVMMRHMDLLRTSQISLEKKLERERKRTQRHYHEATKNMQNYHRLFIASQERYDKLNNLAGSGGASSLGDVFDSDDLPNGVHDRKQLLNSSGIEEDDPGSSSSLNSSTSSSVLGSSLNLNSSNGKVTFAVPHPPSAGKTSNAKRYLSLEIPAGNKGSMATLLPSPSEPSLLSTSDRPSPAGRMLHRSQSGSYLETLRRTSAGQKGRQTASAAATLTISPRKVRQISDPVLKMLHVIHKIIFICQLPPTLSPNPRRRVIERFKKALFSIQSSSVNLKSELKKVCIGSKDLIDLNLGVSETSALLRQASHEEAALQVSGDKTAVANLDAHDTEIGLTYEQMQNFIESVLVESGYYDMTPNARNRTLPLGPITASPPTPRRNALSDS